jgi:hypothetical protein
VRAVTQLTLCRYTFVVGKRLPEEVERLGVLLVGYPHAVPVGLAEAALLPAALATFQLYRNVSFSLTHSGVGTVLQRVYCDVWLYIGYVGCFGRAASLLSPSRLQNGKGLSSPLTALVSLVCIH